MATDQEQRIEVGVPEDQQPVVQPEPDDTRLWSVTTILKSVGSDDGLIAWAAKETAKAAVRARKTLAARVDEDGDDAVVQSLAQARFAKVRGQRTAAELGTAVHELCEQYAITGLRPEVDDECRPFLDQFDRWLQRFSPEYIAAEVTVYHPRYGYAGTCDGFMRIGGMPLVFDYKTSREDLDGRGKPKRPWPTVAMQLAAYRYAEFAAAWKPRRYEKYRRRYYLLGPQERAAAVAVPEVEGGLVIMITPERCEAFPVKCGEDVFNHFLFSIEAARWDNEISKTVIGNGLVAPE